MTLTTQLATLETACAGPLIERLSRDERRQQLTALGRTLLDQAGRHPDAPRDLPEPLASVLGAHWGPKMLATFAKAAACPTLRDSAITLDIHPSSLVRTIRNLEAAVGEPILTDHSAPHAHRAQALATGTSRQRAAGGRQDLAPTLRRNEIDEACRDGSARQAADDIRPRTSRSAVAGRYRGRLCWQHPLRRSAINP